MTIVIGFIRSNEGQAALQRGVEEARRRGDRLVIVNSSRGGHDSGDDVIATDRELQRVSEDLAGAGIEHEVRHLVRGKSPAEDLIQVAQETGAELIVIGMRHRSRVGKAILGSNAQEILLQSSCPVLAVKPESEY